MLFGVTSKVTLVAKEDLMPAEVAAGNLWLITRSCGVCDQRIIAILVSLVETAIDVVPRG